MSNKPLLKQVQLVDVVEEEMLLGYTDPEQLCYRVQSSDPMLCINDSITAKHYVEIVKARWVANPMLRGDLDKERELSLKRYEMLYRAAGSLIRRAKSQKE